jgi:hypothetical protein
MQIIMEKLLSALTRVCLAIAGSAIAYCWSSRAYAQIHISYFPPADQLPLAYKAPPPTVYVTPSDLSTLDQLRNIVPDAFRDVLTVNGNSERIIKAGKFNSRALAEERLQLLLDSGFNAQVSVFKTALLLPPPIIVAPPGPSSIQNNLQVCNYSSSPEISIAIAEPNLAIKSIS